MKRLYVAIVLLLIALSLCSFEQYTVTNAYETATKYINSAIDGLENDDYEKVQSSCRELGEYWSKKYPYMSAMIDHGSLDETGVTINSLNDLAKNKSDELENELITVKNQIKNIYENQKITFGNVF